MENGRRCRAGVLGHAGLSSDHLLALDIAASGSDEPPVRHLGVGRFFHGTGDTRFERAGHARDHRYCHLTGGRAAECTFGSARSAFAHAADDGRVSPSPGGDGRPAATEPWIRQTIAPVGWSRSWFTIEPRTGVGRRPRRECAGTTGPHGALVGPSGLETEDSNQCMIW